MSNAQGLQNAKYCRALIQQQIFDYQRIRLEEEHFEQELSQLKEYSKDLDRMLEHVWIDAQEAIDKDAMFRETYNALMNQEDSQIKRTAQFLQDAVPIRDELFETLCVTNQTERNAVENAADLQLNYQRRIKELVSTRARLQQKLRTFRNQFEQTQEQKRAAYDEVLDLMKQIDHLESEEQLLRLSKLSIT
ncbi:hypothetical protein M3Y97_00126500 [Aphelenchoides bicaudatus]|nr:hypothetical protein M3Y97_00126500 [Aphelenchoides bicaudatus]